MITRGVGGSQKDRLVTNPTKKIQMLLEQVEESAVLVVAGP